MTARRAAGLTWALCLVLALPTLVCWRWGPRTRRRETTSPRRSRRPVVRGRLAGFRTVGALIATRSGATRSAGCSCTAVVISLGDFAYRYADQVCTASSGSGRAARLRRGCRTGPPPGPRPPRDRSLLFPDGRLPSRRWQAALWLASVGIAFIVTGYAFPPGPSARSVLATVTNPLGILEGTFGLDGHRSLGLGWLLMGSCVGSRRPGHDFSVRLRAADGHERLQLKWIALAAAVSGVAVVGDVASFFASRPRASTSCGSSPSALPSRAFRWQPAWRSCATACTTSTSSINRALVNTALTATLAATYLGGVLPPPAGPAPAHPGLQPGDSRLHARRRRADRPGAALGSRRLVDRRFFRRRTTLRSYPRGSSGRACATRSTSTSSPASYAAVVACDTMPTRARLALAVAPRRAGR